VAQHMIENAALIFTLLRIKIGLSEKAFEYRARADFRRQRSRRSAPRNAIRISARIAVIAIAALNSFFASQFERRKTRASTYFDRGNLINRNSDLNILAESLLWMNTGEKTRACAAVIARSIA